jgi:hypothetical protein
MLGDGMATVKDFRATLRVSSLVLSASVAVVAQGDEMAGIVAVAPEQEHVVGSSPAVLAVVSVPLVLNLTKECLVEATPA